MVPGPVAEDPVGMLKVVIGTLVDLDLDGPPNLSLHQPTVDHLGGIKTIALGVIVDRRILRDLLIRIIDLAAGEMVQVTVPGTRAQERASTHTFLDVQGMRD